MHHDNNKRTCVLQSFGYWYIASFARRKAQSLSITKSQGNISNSTTLRSYVGGCRLNIHGTTVQVSSYQRITTNMAPRHITCCTGMDFISFRWKNSTVLSKWEIARLWTIKILAAFHRRIFRFMQIFQRYPA